MIVFAKLALAAPLFSVTKELSSALLNWDAHFNTMNYKGKWTGVALRSVSDRADSIIPGFTSDDVFTDHENMSLFPAIGDFLSKLKCPLGSVRLLNLAAGAEIRPHRDYELCFEQGEVRLHIPLVTNPDVNFYVHDQKLLMKYGECWYINANLRHHVTNSGETDRIHLVIDCKVNDWLKKLMNNALLIAHAPDYSLQELSGMVRALREQNTSAAHRQADELQRQYDDYFSAE